MKYILLAISTFFLTDISSAQCDLSVVDTVHVNCNGDASGSIVLDVSLAFSPYFLYLSNGVVQNDSPTFSNLEAGNYSVSVLDANGCVDTIGFKIKEPSLLELDLSCNDGQIEAVVSGGVEDYLLQWKNEIGEVISLNYEIPFQPNFMFNLDLMDAKGCQIKDSIYLSIDFYLDKMIGDVPLEINVFNNSSEGNYSWDFGDGSSSIDFEPNHTYSEVGEYDLKLVLSNDIGCETEKMIIIDAQGFELAANDWQLLPDAFSPNNDGINDSFTFSENHAIAKFNVEVFNRWGNKVYEWSDTSGAFNGLNNAGNTLEEGVYFYKMSAVGTDGKTYVKNSSLTLFK